jgi:tetratricopeptide (TPR) repeat protein
VVSVMRGDVAGALPLFDQALTVVGDDPTLTDLGLLLQINKSVALGELDRYDEAVNAARWVRQLADHTGSLVRLAQARCALGQLLFEAGRWDDVQAEVEALADAMKDPGTTCCDRGLAAVIAFHRGDVVTARNHLGSAADSAKQIGTRVVSSFVRARSLDHEVADEPGKALAVLTACLASTEELDELQDLLPEAARLAARINATTVLADVVSRAETFVQRSRVPHRLGTVAYCRGLLDGSASLLLVAAEKYGDAGRLLSQAKALEAAAVSLAEQGDRGSARSAFVRADDIGWPTSGGGPAAVACAARPPRVGFTASRGR